MTTPATPSKELTPRERGFVDAFLISRNATRAYLAVCPSVTNASARALGHHLRRRPHVAAEIADGLRAQSARSRAEADEVIRELARIAFSDIHELTGPDGSLLHPSHVPFNVRKAIKHVTVSQERTTTTYEGKKRITTTERIIEYSFHDKVAALDRLAKHLGLTTIPDLSDLWRAFPDGLAASLRDLLTPKPRVTVSEPAALEGAS